MHHQSYAIGKNHWQLESDLRYILKKILAGG